MGQPVEVGLPRDATAPRQARRLIAELCSTKLVSDELYRAKLLVSELVTNAVVHGQGTITLRADIGENRLMVEVIDEGSGFEHVVHHPTFEDVHGRGLMIVDGEASRWGLYEGTTHVWFEIERSGPRLGPSNGPTNEDLD